MNGGPVVLATLAAFPVGVLVGVYLGRLRWFGRCAECRYRLGHRLTDQARGYHHPRHY